ncbi:hypothetical protein [Enhygromyxa salina]|uniref:Uncharacterized protein n=1 Tax=Enhygromyxa salina TaxID=215803 RepID=A0A2S9YVV0_9BACT|nr:hypothetical protein [Enhygromyxa salina]PRQ09169.1 hypothetical protein ENSA7_11590 [Enhygromyxa salina]
MFASCWVCAAALLLPHSSHATPPPADTRDRSVCLEVDVEGLGDSGIGLDQTVRAQLGPRITQAGFVLVAADEATVVLQVRFRALQSGDYDYGVHFELVDHDQREPVIEWVDCHMCVDARLMPLLDEQTPKLLAALDARVAAVEPEPRSVPPPVLMPARDVETGEIVAEPDRSVEPPPRRITTVGISGAVIAGIGVGVLIGAGRELSRGVVVDDVGREQVVRVDHRPSGYVLLGVGTTAVAAGLTMLLVDVGRQTRLYPLASRDDAGLGVIGKF